MTLKTLELKRNTSRQTSTIFVSSNVKSAKAIVLLLCDGLWSNKIHVKDSLLTVLAFLEWAHGLGMAVVVLNPSEVAFNVQTIPSCVFFVCCGTDKEHCSKLQVPTFRLSTFYVDGTSSTQLSLARCLLSLLTALEESSHSIF
ncbi:uncharacterized protein LOC9632999 [Selaginella moellendorffii]|uniref:uncharacterized protein LOC9632999 n=1 Tax=Selaginella moellendorffii TaxID=88036 RepID=UPI000D1C6B25|nr:uncharacterized protein LOC9632999 [Selaginella moellendorffii]|eukprot:XP_024531387.1 uncharacterized protein LOC9632999 [Selaginella moellendorffii]